MQHPCKSELPKWLMRTLANTANKPEQHCIKSSLEELTCQALSFDGEVTVEPYLDFRDLPSWGAVPQEVVRPLRKCEVQQAFSCEKYTFWKWALESRSPTYMFMINPEYTQVLGFLFGFFFIWKAYFWKASRLSQPVINKVFTQLKLMATYWQITLISFCILTFLSDTG